MAKYFVARDKTWGGDWYRVYSTKRFNPQAPGASVYWTGDDYLAALEAAKKANKERKRKNDSPAKGPGS